VVNFLEMHFSILFHSKPVVKKFQNLIYVSLTMAIYFILIANIDKTTIDALTGSLEEIDFEEENSTPPGYYSNQFSFSHFHCV